MEKVYNELAYIFEDMRALLYEVGKYNPGVESDHRQKPANLAATMGTMVTQLNSLRIDVLAVPEREHVENL